LAGTRGIAFAAEVITSLAPLLARSGRSDVADAWAQRLAHEAGRAADVDALGAAVILLDAVGMSTEADWTRRRIADRSEPVGVPLSMAAHAEHERAARLLDELRDAVAVMPAAERARMLAAAVPTLRALRDERAEDWTGETLALLDDPSFDERYAIAVPGILAKLAEGSPDPGRLLNAAAGLSHKYWRRRAVAAVAAAASGSLDAMGAPG
jgi:hypothetical protein